MWVNDFKIHHCRLYQINVFVQLKNKIICRCRLRWVTHRRRRGWRTRKDSSPVPSLFNTRWASLSCFLIFLLVLPLFKIPFSFQLELQQSCDISRMVSVLTFRGFTFIFYLLSLVCNLWENCPQQFAQGKDGGIHILCELHHLFL